MMVPRRLKSWAALLTAAALVLVHSPVSSLHAAGIQLAPSAVGSSVGGSAVGASGAAVGTGLSVNQGLQPVSLGTLSLDGSGAFDVRTRLQPKTSLGPTVRIAVPSAAAGVRTGRIETSAQKTAVSRSLGPVLRKSLPALASPVRRLRRGADESQPEGKPGRSEPENELGALEKAGEELKDEDAADSDVLDRLFMGTEGKKEDGGVAASAPEPSPVLLGRAARPLSSDKAGPSPPAKAEKVERRKAFLRSKVVKWGGITLLAAPIIVLAPSVAHAAVSLIPFSAAFDAVSGSVLTSLSQGAYLLANALGFFYAFPQVYKIFTNKSGEVAAGTIMTGALASIFLGFNAAYTAKMLWTVQNLLGFSAFVSSLVLMWWYRRASDRAPVRKKSGFWRSDKTKAAAAFAVLFAASAAASALLVSAVPALPFAGFLIVPFQMAAALGFAFLFLPQFIKTEMDKSSGDASPLMTIGYLLATASIGYWALIEAAAIPAGVLAGNFLILALSLAAVTVPSHIVLKSLAKLPWHRIPEKVSWGGLKLNRETVIGAVSLVLLASYMAAILGLGYAGLSAALVLPAEGANTFWMFLLYVVENLFSALVSVYALQAYRRYHSKSAPPSSPDRSQPTRSRVR